MHRIRFNLVDINPKRFLIAYYNSIGLAFTELEGRSYGGGVLEILPGELEKMMFVNVFDESVISDQEIEIMFCEIDRLLRNSTNDDIIDVIDYMDNYLLIDKMKFENEDLTKFRHIWLKLRDRRLSRGKTKKKKL